ncbi:MAG TPA: LytTR family DNA-binding domain-containing protein [Vicinamibacterales bacterium]|nr:response regulator transcription factor [Acidobacteriota bacterium]HQX80383.1 LytTR family DNA-binding domain-containing protein [Vicinamibacterales bacterium]
MRVLIADDEEVSRNGLRALLAAEPDVTIVGEAATGEGTEELLRTHDVDVLILDIQMPQKTGLDVVAGIDPAQLPLVIFATAHDEHAIRAFELHALDYLVKPYREDRLREAIGRARALVGRRHLGQFRQRVGVWVAAQPAYPSRIRIEERERIRFVAVRDIQWIEAQDYCVLLHLAGERILRRGTLKQFLRTIDPASMVRVHRSAAVNIRHVRELTITVSGGLVARVTSGAEVPVARTCREALEERLRALP